MLLVMQFPGIMSTEDKYMRLGGLCGLRRCKLGAKDCVPKTTRDAEAVLVVCVVVLKMILLELFVVGWKAATAISVRYRAQRRHETYVL